ncbi:MAG: LacI family DNA-binding transcriptional regulator [Lentisphaeria bacterium]|nr:LacI family DNA-binding transcriptional regulator [Lentisphaeria bacterium]
MKKVTLTDVARLANVSSSAAGKVLNGDGDPLFDSMNIASLDPRYEDIASALLKLLLHPETRDTVPVIEAIYKREMRDDPPSLKLPPSRKLRRTSRRTRR